jgi:hypothetical protein
METGIYSDYEPGREAPRVKKSARVATGEGAPPNTSGSSEKVELGLEQPGATVRVRVVKACPNPRLADCLVLEGEQEGQRILVDVRKSAVFYPGVELEAVRARGDSKYAWEYRGPLPRWRGDRCMGSPCRGRQAGAVRGQRGIHVVG